MAEKQMRSIIELDAITNKCQLDSSVTPENAMSDPDALPMSDDDWKRVKPIKRKKESVTIRIDADVVDYYRSAYPKYQLGMNEVLRDGMKNRQKAG